MQATRPRKQRIRLSEKDIRNVIKEYETSGNTVVQFCQVKNFNISTFQRWRRKYDDRDIAKPNVTFVPINIATQDNNHANNATLFAEVHGIKLYRAMPAEYLLTLLNH